VLVRMGQADSVQCGEDGANKRCASSGSVAKIPCAWQAAACAEANPVARALPSARLRIRVQVLFLSAGQGVRKISCHRDHVGIAANAPGFDLTSHLVDPILARLAFTTCCLNARRHAEAAAE
jgi:hypothetical protein